MKIEYEIGNIRRVRRQNGLVVLLFRYGAKGYKDGVGRAETKGCIYKRIQTRVHSGVGCMAKRRSGGSSYCLDVKELG